MNFFIRKCPQCNKELTYETQKGFNSAEKINAKCPYCNRKNREEKNKKDGPYFRNCPICNKELSYSLKNNRDSAEKLKANCSSCRAKINNNKPEVKEKLSKASSGENNPMYGKTFYDVWSKKYTDEEVIKKRKQHSKNTSNHNKQNMKGKSIYDVWLNKYGKEIANEKYKEWKEKISKASSGENNGMYGKPSPFGSGNGWSGHCKQYYFRSIRELSYLIYLLDNNINFEPGERKKNAIPYILPNGKKRNYFPDYYLTDTDEFIEIKPKNLVNSYINKIKFKAGFEKHENKFKILTEDNIQMIDLKRLYNMYQNKEIIWDKGYEEKFLNYYNENK